MTPEAVSIRPADERDLDALTELYDHYVQSSAVTFDVAPVTSAARRTWLAHYAPRGRHRLLVAECARGVCGYASSSRLRDKAAYETSVETTVYLAPDWAGRGIGSRLYGALFEALADEDVHRAYAGVTLPNPASLALHERFGFRRLAVWDEVGRKFDRYWSVLWLEKRL